MQPRALIKMHNWSAGLDVLKMNRFFFQECSLKHPVLPCLLFGIYFSGSGDIPVQWGNKLVWCFCLAILIGVVKLVFVEEWWCRQTWWGFVSRALRLLFKTGDVHHDQAYWRASDNKAAYYQYSCFFLLVGLNMRSWFIGCYLGFSQCVMSTSKTY